MNTPKTAPDFGEPWVLQNEGNNLWVALRDESEVIGDIVCDAPSHEYVASVAHWPDRASRIVTCVNACAGMADPAAEIQALRDAASCLSRLADHGHAEDCLFLNRANAPCDCGVDQAQATLAKLRSLL